MHRLLTFLAACVLSGAMASAQGRATDQAPASGTQSSGNRAVPTSSGTSLSRTQRQISHTPSTPNQALPGDSNPANAATPDGQANGSAVRPNADSRSASPPESSENDDIKRDDPGSNPASPHASATNPDIGGRGTAPWLWIALLVMAIIALISALASRRQTATELDKRDPRWRTPGEPDVIRHEEIYRARPDDIDRDQDQIRRAS